VLGDRSHLVTSPFLSGLLVGCLPHLFSSTLSCRPCLSRTFPAPSSCISKPAPRLYYNFFGPSLFYIILLFPDALSFHRSASASVNLLRHCCASFLLCTIKPLLRACSLLASHHRNHSCGLVELIHNLVHFFGPPSSGHQPHLVLFLEQPSSFVFPIVDVQAPTTSTF